MIEYHDFPICPLDSLMNYLRYCNNGNKSTAGCQRLGVKTAGKRQEKLIGGTVEDPWENRWLTAPLNCMCERLRGTGGSKKDKGKLEGSSSIKTYWEPEWLIVITSLCEMGRAEWFLIIRGRMLLVLQETFLQVTGTVPSTWWSNKDLNQADFLSFLASGLLFLHLLLPQLHDLTLERAKTPIRSFLD